MSSAASFSDHQPQPLVETPSTSAPSRGRRSSWIISLDQSIFSGANFVVTVLIGRLAGRDELGLYALIFATLVLLSGFQRALIISPYTFQSQRLAGRRRDLRRGSAVALSVIVAALLGMLAWVCWSSFNGDAIMPGWIVAGALFGWCLRDSCRRLAFADHRYGEAALVDLAATTPQVAMLLILGTQASLTAAGALAVLAATNLLTAAAWGLLIKRRLLFAPRHLATNLRASWRFGRWAALSEAIYSGQDAAIQAVLTLGGGLATTGIYAACMSVVRLANPFVQAMGNLAGPACALALAKDGIAGLTAQVSRYTRLAGAVMALFVLLTALFGSIALEMIYGDDYTGNRFLLVTLAAAAGLNGIGMLPAKAISAFEKPQINFFVSLLSLVLAVALAVIGMRRDALGAAAAAVFAGACVSASARWWWYRRLARSSRGGGAR